MHCLTLEIKYASLYVIVNNLLNYLTLVPLVMLDIADIMGEHYALNTEVRDIFAGLVIIFQSMYGILNVFLYGCMNRSYTRHALSKVQCKTKIAQLPMSR